MKQNQKPNIILIVMDCARADHLSCYGYHRRTTPFLDQLASQGILYENAISPAGWTLPAHWSLFTGLFLTRHGAWNRNLAASPQYPSLAQVLSEAGYDTIAFSNNPHVGVKTGFGRGFDTFEELFRIREQHSVLNLAKRAANKILVDFFKLRYDGAFRTNRAIKKWLSTRPDPQRPFFIFVNYMDAHEPYQPPWPYRSRFMDDQVKTASKSQVADYVISTEGKLIDSRASDWEIEENAALYDAELAFLDSQLGSLVRHLERQGMLDNSLLIFTSDHGQGLGENGRIGHTARWLYDAQVRVPLILYAPNVLSSGIRVSEQVQLVDIMPTILEMLGQEQHNGVDQIQGRNILPPKLIDSQPPFTVTQAHYFDRGLEGERKLVAIRTDEHKYIWIDPGQDELYHLESDPAESHNLIDQKPDLAHKLYTQMQEWLASNGPGENQDQEYAAQEVELDAEIEERLRALGYIE